MLSRLSILSGSLLGLVLLSDLCAAQVCPNLQYGLATKQVGAAPWCLVSGDVNGDGTADLLVGRSPLFTPGGVSLLLNAGGLFPIQTDLTGAWSPRSLALGDMDLDGDLDLVVADQGILGSSGFGNDGVDVFKNDGQGHFGSMQQSAFDTSDDEPQGLRLGDLDGDGDLDAVVVIRLHQSGPLTVEARVLVYLNDGQGTLAMAGAFPAGGKPGNIELVDFDGDGALDYAVVSEIANGVGVALGHGDGTFDTTLAPYVVGTYASGLTSGDFDRDGDLDLAVGWKYGLRVLVNQGNGTFVNGPAEFFGYYNKALAAGDFNQDGNLDLLATLASPGDVKFLAGKGDSTFSASMAYSAGTQAYGLAIGDWNGDSILDVATEDNNSSELRIWSSECGTWIYCTAKLNSLGCLPHMSFTGVPSASAGNGFTLAASNVRNNESSILFYGTGGRAALPFRGGTMCIATPLRRTPVQDSGGSSTGADCSGHLSFDFNAYIGSGINPSLLPGTRVDAQFYSRDAGFPAPNNVGLTDAIEFTIGP